MNALSQTSGTVIVVTSPAIASLRPRGKNKQAAWRMPEGQPIATIVLSLDTCDPHARKRLEALYFTLFNLRRDLVSAAPGTCVVHTGLSDPPSARGDCTRAATLLATLSSPSRYPGRQDALTSQTHPLVSPRRSDATHHGARSTGHSRRTARLNASSTAQSTNGPGSLVPARVAHGSALSCISPPGD